MAALAYIGVALLSVKGADLERRALADPAAFAVMIAVLAAIAAAAWWRTSALAGSEEGALRFEEEPDPAIIGLGLHRDGTLPPIALSDGGLRVRPAQE
jgi:hypothetical protein